MFFSPRMFFFSEPGELLRYCSVRRRRRRRRRLRLRRRRRPHLRYEMCGRRFLRNCWAKFNETWYNNYIEGAVDARCFIFEIGSFLPRW